MTEPDTPRPPRRRRFATVAGVLVIIAAVGVAGVYGIAGLKRNAPGDATCKPAVALARKLDPLARGEVAALTMASVPLKLPDLTFNDEAGAPKKLSDWRGKTVLVNLWATWCVPCRKEMPALDRLQARLGSDKFQVVAINIDTRDPERPRAFMKDIGATHLGGFHDQTAKVFQDLKSIGKALGMPTSMLVDGRGCELGTIAGPAEWDSEDAVRLINAATGQQAS